MEDIDTITNSLDQFFEIHALERDPGFGDCMPRAYELAGRPWEGLFEADFSRRFNGLVFRGRKKVKKVWLAAFPSEEVLAQFFSVAEEGDLLFSHHPIDMRCGDPRGSWASGFVPLAPEVPDEFRRRGLSFYALHAPLDYHPTVNTSASIVAALNARPVGTFAPYGFGYAGIICRIDPCSTEQLIERSTALFGVPYVDFAGPRHEKIETVAVIAGCGDVVELMEYAETMGVQGYLTGEIRCHIDSAYGKMRFAMMDEYIERTGMSLIGVSHAASEHLIMRNEMREWFRTRFSVQTEVLAEQNWWR
jgi:putative NIF3 family GTP cyclohydrolase 1 type 2